jgi:hypothetical protein
MPKRKRSSCSPTSEVENTSRRRHTQPQPLPAFHHDPLDQEVDSIRLIEILPDSDDQVIRCKMRHATISEASYECLSYTWLPKFPEHEIEVNGHELTVGDNLYQFLAAHRTYQRGLHPPGYSNHSDDLNPTLPSFWIDAICIDQSNLSERNHQVRQMGRIYRRAQQVLIWLGELDEDMLRLFYELDKMNKPSSADAYIRSQKPLSYTDPLDLAIVKTHTTNFDDPHRNKLRQQLWKFMTLPYWSRVWIAQEILLPEGAWRGYEVVKIFLGTRVMDFNHVYKTVCNVEKVLVLPLMSLGVKTDIHTYEMYHAYGGGRKQNYWSLTRPKFGLSLPELLPTFRHCKSGDRRDRIFALLSLAGRKPQIDIDYAIDEISLFQHVMEQFMDGTALDELLWFGATLIEALELRCPQKSHAAMECLDSTGLPICGPPRASIGNPIWAKTILLVAEAEEDHNHTDKLMHSVSFTIRDGNDIHILEYATQESEAGVGVRYARTYEYVHGRPAHVRHRGWQVETEMEKEHSDELFAWVDMPSEDVYYCRFSLTEFDGDPPALQIWKTDNVKQRHVTSLSDGHAKRPRLAPSKRYWKQNKLFTWGHVRFDMLPAALVAMGELVKAQNQQAGNFTAPSTRGTLLHWNSPRSASWYRIPETMAELHPGYKEFTRVVEEANTLRDVEVAEESV